MRKNYHLRHDGPRTKLELVLAYALLAVWVIAFALSFINARGAGEFSSLHLQSGDDAFRQDAGGRSS